MRKRLREEHWRLLNTFIWEREREREREREKRYRHTHTTHTHTHTHTHHTHTHTDELMWTINSINLYCFHKHRRTSKRTQSASFMTIKHEWWHMNVNEGTGRSQNWLIDLVAYKFVNKRFVAAYFTIKHYLKISCLIQHVTCFFIICKFLLFQIENCFLFVHYVS